MGKWVRNYRIHRMRILLRDTCMTDNITLKFYVFLQSTTTSQFHYDSYTELSEKLAYLEEKTILA